MHPGNCRSLSRRAFIQSIGLGAAAIAGSGGYQLRGQEKPIQGFEKTAAEAETSWTRALEIEARWNRYQLWELDQAIEQVPKSNVAARGRLALALGGLLQRQGELEPALEQYRLATALLPDDAGAWNNLGVAHALRGSMKEALDDFVRALRLKPGDPPACQNARRAASELGAAPPELGGCRGRSG